MYKLKNSIKNYKEINEVDEYMINIFHKLEEKITKNNNIEKSNGKEFNFEEEDLK